MKKLLILLSCLYIQTARTCEFLKSQKKEFEELAEYYTDHTIETIQDIKNQILADPFVSKKIHNRNQIMSIQQVLENYQKKEEYKKFLINMQDMQRSFDVLKITMQIPSEIEIWYVFDQTLNPDALMSYMPFDRTVYVYPSSLDLTPAYRLFTLIHELTHVKQHQRHGFLDFHLLDLHQKEHEADTNAAKTITCFLCFQVIVAEQLLRETTISIDAINNNRSKGYLISDDLKKHLLEKSLTNLCNAHKNRQFSELCSDLDTKNECQKRCIQDFDLNIADRLSFVNT